jgi:cardiolipin synthase
MVALVLQSGLLFLALFEPGLPYTISKAPAERLDSPEFLHVLSALTRAPIRHYDKLEVLTNGEVYYPAELDAIRKAQRSINLEAYIFQDGEVAGQFVKALAERARAGVHVNILADALGSTSLYKRDLRELLDAGGRLAWYHPIRWHTWPRINNRTHRELLIIDGKLGFVGGSGWADHWLKSEKDNPRWRDTMVRTEGAIVTGLQATFAENWLEASGEILTGREYFPMLPATGPDRALVVGSSPGAGRSTEARVLFQTLLASAREKVYITTPYFLPDSSIRGELVRAVKERGVDVRIVVPGHKSDHALTRNSSRRLYGELLQAGAKIYEYQPSMIHTKSLVIDSLWSVVGSTNMDSRSFHLNDEVNLAVADADFAARLEQDFQQDLSKSRQITYEVWRKRPMIERVQEWFGSIYERQQ